MEVFEKGGHATIQVKAGGPGFDYNIIPADAWYRELVPGLSVNYYEGQWKKLPDFKELKPIKTDVLDNVDNKDKDGNFLTSGRKDNVGAVIEGFVSVPKS